MGGVPCGRKCSRAFTLTVAVADVHGTVTSAGQTGVREVSATERGVIPLQTRLRYTTMVVLPHGEEILDVLCGDRDFWVISATQNIAHVKPAKAGAETNLNLVTSSGTIYSFMLTRKVEPARHQGLRSRRAGSSDRETEVLLGGAGGDAGIADRRGLRASARRRAQAGRGCRRLRQQYPTRLQFPYGSPKYEKPFFVRSMWHDGEFTYLKTDATSCPRSTS